VLSLPAEGDTRRGEGPSVGFDGKRHLLPRQFFNPKRRLDDTFDVSGQGVLRRERHFPRWLRRTLLVVGIGLVALLVLDWIVHVIMVSHPAIQDNEVSPAPPPHRMIMCDSGPTPACAAKAAEMAQSTVAWMPAPTGYQLRWLVAWGGENRRSLAYEYLVSDSFTLNLESYPDPSQPLDYNAHLGTTFDIGGTQVSAYVPNDATTAMLMLAWTHEDKEYRLYVMPASLFDAPIIAPAEFAPLVADVRYASSPS
jgi:hypothetical protein